MGTSSTKFELVAQHPSPNSSSSSSSNDVQDQRWYPRAPVFAPSSRNIGAVARVDNAQNAEIAIMSFYPTVSLLTSWYLKDEIRHSALRPISVAWSPCSTYLAVLSAPSKPASVTDEHPTIRIFSVALCGQLVKSQKLTTPTSKHLDEGMCWLESNNTNNKQQILVCATSGGAVSIFRSSTGVSGLFGNSRSGLSSTISLQLGQGVTHLMPWPRSNHHVFLAVSDGWLRFDATAQEDELRNEHSSSVTRFRALRALSSNCSLRSSDTDGSFAAAVLVDRTKDLLVVDLTRGGGNIVARIDCGEELILAKFLNHHHPSARTIMTLSIRGTLTLRCVTSDAKHSVLARDQGNLLCAFAAATVSPDRVLIASGCQKSVKVIRVVEK